MCCLSYKRVMVLSCNQLPSMASPQELSKLERTNRRRVAPISHAKLWYGSLSVLDTVGKNVVALQPCVDLVDRSFLKELAHKKEDVNCLQAWSCSDSLAPHD